MQESLCDSGCRRNFIREEMQEYLHQAEDAGDTPSERKCRFLSIRQQIQETLSESGCRSLSIRQRMQVSLYQTTDAGDSISDSGCRRLSIR